MSGPAFLRAGWPRSRGRLSGRCQLALDRANETCRVAAATASEPPELQNHGSTMSGAASNQKRRRRFGCFVAGSRRPLADTSMGSLAPAHPAPLVGWPPLPLVTQREQPVFFLNWPVRRKLQPTQPDSGSGPATWIRIRKRAVRKRRGVGQGGRRLARRNA